MNKEYADTVFKKTFGLMLRRPDNYHMEFTFKESTRAPVHTWFCRMPITITFVSVDGKEETYRNVPPYMWITPKNGYIKIVETT